MQHGAFDEFYDAHLAQFRGRLTHPLLGEAVVADLAAALLRDSLFAIGTRTLISEFLTREESRLADADPAADDVYRSFAARLAQGDLRRAVLQDHPELDRLLRLRCERTADLVLDACRHLEEDRVELAERGLDPGTLRRVQVTSGDAHNGGRRVLVLHGETTTVAYKPRPVDADVLVADLVTALRDLDPDLRMRPVPVLGKPDHGWQEFVHHRPCGSLAEVRAYHRSAGQWLAFFHTLGGTDLHYENVIAAGPDPQFIDLETALAHVTGEGLGARYTHHAVINQTVIGTMLLPGAVANSVFDVSIAGLGAGQAETSQERYTFDVGGLGTNGIAFQQVPLVIEPGTNRVVLDGRPCAPAAYADEIEAGFVHVLDLMAEHADLVARVVAAHGTTTVRKVLRPTAVYSRFIDASLHPRYLRDPAERRRLLELIRGSDQDLNVGSFPQVHDAEVAAMLDLDVPYFAARLDDTRLEANRTAVIPDYFRTRNLDGLLTSLREAADRPAGEPASASDDGVLDRAVIHLSMACSPPGPDAPPQGTPSRFLLDLLTPGDGGEVARGVARHLRQVVRRDEHEVPFWILPRPASPTSWVLDRSAPTLADGGGIAAFLTATGWAGDPRLEEERSRELDRVCAEGDLSLFSGLGSWLVLAHARGDAVPADRVEATLAARIATVRDRGLRRGAGRDAGVDVDFTNGLAGAGAVLAAVAPTSGAGVADDAVDLLLRALAADCFDGAGELAHGDAGMLWGAAAWLRLADASPDDTRRDQVADRLAGLVAGLGAGPTRDGWCRGRHGALLAASATARLLGVRDHDDALVRRLEQLLRERPVSIDPTLCHGTAGEAEALMGAATLLGLGSGDGAGDGIRAQVRDRFLAQLARLADTGWTGGLRDSAGNPSYLLGLAGVGHVAQRLAAPTGAWTSLLVPLPVLPPDHAAASAATLHGRVPA